VAIVLAGAWALYTFYRSEAARESAPSHVTSSIELRQFTERAAGTRKPQRLIPIEILVSLHNSSTQTVHNIGGLLVVWGHKYSGDSTKERKEFNELANQVLNADQPYMLERHSPLLSSDLLALLPLDTPAWLNPNEVSKVQYRVHVKRDAYDYIETLTLFPTSLRKGRLLIRWQVAQDGNSLEPIYYRIQPDGTRVQLSRKDYIEWSARTERDNQFQMATTSATLEVP
jgi:hypothetical protein